MSQLTNDKNLNLGTTLVLSSTTSRPVRARKLASVVALGAVLTLAVFAGRAEAGLASQNGMSSQNGLFTQNGMKVHNGLTAQNGMKVHNGLAAQNGMKVHNGLNSQNGMKVHNGLNSQNGMKVHNGVMVSGTWFMRTINPARSLSAAVRARR
jgi:hypothetical protein